MKKKTILLIICSTLFCINLFSSNQEIVKETFIFSIKGNDTLRLDKYDVPAKKEPKPCVMFLFGGGFVTGKRDNPSYKAYFDFFLKEGYTVISIDYRLGMKEVASQNSSSDINQLIKLLNHSISIATEDLFEATRFIIDHAKEWNIDQDKIIATGSSAGGITTLQGAYEIANQTKLAQILPPGFNYAGVIGYAGAILSKNHELSFKTPPAPMQLFHGTADGNVPYHSVVFGDIGLYGSRDIVKVLDKMNVPYYFFSVKNAAHEISGTPMSQNLEDINYFIKEFALKKQKLVINTQFRDINKEEPKNPIQIEDYIKNNGF